MKFLIVFLLVILTQIDAFAIPVVNENVANSGIVTVYPDSHDPNRFYIAPNMVVIGSNEENIPLFNYQEIATGYYEVIFGGKKVVGYTGISAFASFSLVAAYTNKDLELVKASLIAKFPNAEFSGLPFLKSELSVDPNIKILFSDTSCTHLAGLVGQEQSCTLVFTKIGRKTFLRSLEKKMLFTNLNFEYEFEAVVRRADGSFEDRFVKHGVAARIDGNQIAKFPNNLILIDESLVRNN